MSWKKKAFILWLVGATCDVLCAGQNLSEKHISTVVQQRPNSWTKSKLKLTQPLTVSRVQLLKPDRKPYPLTYGLRSLHINLKSENSQDFAQKTQWNCTFMNSASALHNGWMYRRRTAGNVRFSYIGWVCLVKPPLSRDCPPIHCLTVRFLKFISVKV